jgi:hypothetical protein
MIRDAARDGTDEHRMGFVNSQCHGSTRSDMFITIGRKSAAGRYVNGPLLFFALYRKPASLLSAK